MQTTPSDVHVVHITGESYRLKDKRRAGQTPESTTTTS